MDTRRRRSHPDVPARSFRGQLRDQSVDGPGRLGERRAGARGRREERMAGAAPQAQGARRPDRAGAAGAGAARSRLHRQCRRGAWTGVALLARFRHPERQGEEAHFERAFCNLEALCMIDEVRTTARRSAARGRRRLRLGSHAAACSGWAMGRARIATRARWCRSASASRPWRSTLADARFYHMDTALCPLSGGEVMYVPHGLHRRRARGDPRPGRARTTASPSARRMRPARRQCRVPRPRHRACRAAAPGCARRLEERGYRVHESARRLRAQRRLGLLPHLAARPSFRRAAARAAESAAPALVFG